MSEKCSYELKAFDELTLLDLYSIIQLRELVFVLEQNCPYLDCDGRDPSSYHLMGKNSEGKLLVYCRILPPGISYPEYASIGRVVSHTQFRNLGLGRELMSLAMEKVKLLFPDVPIKISAQQYLVSFYQDFGFLATGEDYLEDGIPHCAMVYNKLHQAQKKV
jgi:ElaA protein